MQAAAALPYREKELPEMTYRPIGIVPLRNYGAASYRTACVLHRVKSKGGEKQRERTSYGGRVSMRGLNQRTPIRTDDPRRLAAAPGLRFARAPYPIAQRARGIIYGLNHADRLT